MPYISTMKNIDTLIAGLDIGSSKIGVSLARITPQTGWTKPIASIAHKSRGFSQQTILNMDWLEESILGAIHAAEQQAKVKIKNVYVSVPAGLVRSRFVESVIDLPKRPIDDAVLQKILNTPFAEHHAKEEQIIHILPITYQLDELEHVLDPRKMIGQCLRTKIHLVCASKSFINNVRAVLKHYDFKVRAFVASPYADGIDVMHSPLHETIVVNFGAENTTISCFINNTLVSFQNVPFGSLALTQELAQKLGVGVELAERMKIQQGYISEHIALAVHQSSDRVNQIIFQQMESLTIQVYDMVRHCSPNTVIVLTGGGAQMNGLADFWSRCFERPIKLMIDPAMATSCGLLKYGYYDHFDKFAYPSFKQKQNFWDRLKKLFMEEL